MCVHINLDKTWCSHYLGCAALYVWRCVSSSVSPGLVVNLPSLICLVLQVVSHLGLVVNLPSLICLGFLALKFIFVAFKCIINGSFVEHLVRTYVLIGCGCYCLCFLCHECTCGVFKSLLIIIGVRATGCARSGVWLSPGSRPWIAAKHGCDVTIICLVAVQQ